MCRGVSSTLMPNLVLIRYAWTSLHYETSYHAMCVSLESHSKTSPSKRGPSKSGTNEDDLFVNSSVAGLAAHSLPRGPPRRHHTACPFAPYSDLNTVGQAEIIKVRSSISMTQRGDVEGINKCRRQSRPENFNTYQPQPPFVGHWVPFRSGRAKCDQDQHGERPQRP